MKQVSIFFFLLLVTVATYASSFFYAPVTGSATGTSALVMAQNNLRQYLLIQNTGGNPISVKFGSVQSGDEGVLIAAGASYAPVLAPSNSIYLKATTSTSTYMIIQGN